MLGIIKELKAVVKGLSIWNHTEKVIEAANDEGFTMKEMEAITAICRWHNLRFRISASGCGEHYPVPVEIVFRKGENNEQSN